jgi:hypothetical protein
MAFIPPKTFAVGEVLSAIDMNTFVRDNTNALNVGFRLLNRRIFDSAGSFTFSKADPMGDGSIDGSIIRAYRIICVGGGGAGGGGKATGAGQCSPASGGASGAFAERFALASAYPSTVPVVVGAAGVPATADNGGNGGASSFAATGGGPVVSAFGGEGGRVAVTVGDFPRSSINSFLLGSVNGDITDAGEAGQGALCILTGGTGSSIGGTGGSGKFGSGGPGFGSTTGASFSDARGFGAGGGGRSTALENTAATAGGAGTGGLVVVELYA